MNVILNDHRTYPHGVPCWVDTGQSDLEQAQHFYGGLFGWTFGGRHGHGDSGVVSHRPTPGPRRGRALTSGGRYAGSMEHLHRMRRCRRIGRRGGRVPGGTVISPTQDAGPGGRAATCADPIGAEFRLWQARRRLGAQLANAPGSWNFSDLHTTDRERALAFYAAVFGWQVDSGLASAMIRVPGYGDHLASTTDPHIYQRQAGAPPGFADAVAGLEDTDGAPGWHVRFTVADRDSSVASAESLGATVLAATDTLWTKEALIRDPQGAELTISQFAPPT